MQIPSLEGGTSGGVGSDAGLLSPESCHVSGLPAVNELRLPVTTVVHVPAEDELIDYRKTTLVGLAPIQVLSRGPDESAVATAEEGRELDDPEDVLAPNLVGTLAHDTLERFDYSDCSDEAIKRTIEQFGESTVMNEAVFPRVKAVIEYLKEDMLNAKEDIRELPFVAGFGDSGNRLLVDGKIDLLYRLDGKWHIVDYKFTNSSGEEIREEYAFQLQLYEAALKSSGNRHSEDSSFSEASSISLLLLGCNKAAEVTPVPVQPLSSEDLTSKALSNAQAISSSIQ